MDSLGMAQHDLQVARTVIRVIKQRAESDGELSDLVSVVEDLVHSASDFVLEAERRIDNEESVGR